LNASLKVADHWSLQGVLYYRQYTQDVSNGNTTNYTACTTAALAGSLCQFDRLTPVINAAGQNLPDISDDGAILIGENDFETINSYRRGATLQASSNQSILGHDNQFTVGVTLDYAHVNFYSGAQIGVLNSQLLVLPSNLIVDTPVSLIADNKDLGGYVTDTFNVTPALALTASGRFDVGNIDLHDQLGTSLDGTSRFRRFNPAIGGIYKVLPTLTVYARLSTNTRTPTASEIEYSDPLKPCLLPSNLAGNPPNLYQVVAHTAELGVRGKILGVSDADRGLSWNLGVFRTNSFNDIYGIATSVSSGFFQKSVRRDVRVWRAMLRT